MQPITAMQRVTGREGASCWSTDKSIHSSPRYLERGNTGGSSTPVPPGISDLRLDGQGLKLVGVDLPLGGQPQPVDQLLLAPGNCADLLVTTHEGTTALRALPYNRGRAMGMGRMGSEGTGNATGPVVELAGLTVTGPTAEPLAAVRARPALRDLRTEQVINRRRITLAMNMGSGPGIAAFTIDGREFDPGRVDQLVTAGAVEEWTITNTSPMDHPFHLHVWPMQVLSIADTAIDCATWQNVVNIPARSSTTVRVVFDMHTGRTVYHCHILDHEDNGMMGVIEVR